MSLFLTIRHVEFFPVRGRLFDDFVWVHRRETFGFTLLVNPGVLLNVVSLFKSSTCRTSSDFSDQIFFVRILSFCVVLSCLAQAMIYRQSFGLNS